MSTQTSRNSVVQLVLEVDRARWQGGIMGGLFGAIGFGLFMTVAMPDVIGVAIPNMYGFEATAASPALATGWGFHLLHGAFLGMPFACMTRLNSHDGYPLTYARAGVMGMLYGIMMWGIMGMIMMPVWLNTVGFAGAPGVPHLDQLSMIGHVVYGVLLGVGFKTVF